MKNYLLLSLILLLASFNLFSQNVYVVGTNGDWDFDADNQAALKQDLGSSSYYGKTIQAVHTGVFKVTYGSGWANNWGGGYWIPGSGNLNTIWSIPSGGGDATWQGDNIGQLKSYTHLCIKDPQGSTGSNLQIGILTLSASPVDITALTNLGSQTYGNSATITATLSGTACAEEHVYLRYSTDSWSSSSIVEMTTSGSSAAYTMDLDHVGTYSYYAFTSTVDLTTIQAASDKDILTIAYENNSGNNYSATVSQIDPPTSLSATENGTDEVNISWALNSGSNNVLLFCRQDAAPDDLSQGTSYSVGDGSLAAASGKVLYKGTNLSFNHTSLDASTNYHYKIVSVNNDYYSTVSASEQANATTDALTADLAISGTLSETNLNGATVSLTLSNETFADDVFDKSNFTIYGSPNGTEVSSVSHNSTTAATLTLSFDGTDFDTNHENFYVKVAAEELSGSNDLSSDRLTVSATDDSESINLAWHTSPGTNGEEATMDEEVIRATLAGGQFLSSGVNTTNITASGTATSSGVSIESVSFVDAKTVDVSLAWDGTDYDADKVLTLSFADAAYTDGSSTIIKDISLSATMEPAYTVGLSETNKTVLDEITIVFEDVDPVVDFYSDNQDYVFMHVGLHTEAGGNWQYVQSFTRNGSGNIDVSGNESVMLTEFETGKYSITVDPVSFFGPLADGEQVNGIDIVLFNQYNDAANNKTSDLYIDLVDAIYNTVSINPTTPTVFEALTVTFNAKGTSLQGESKVYFHSGVATDEPGSKEFSIGLGNWGSDDGVGLMTQKAGSTDIWEITMTSISNYYSLPSNDNAFTLNCLFRDASGSTKVDGADNYHLELDPGNYMLLEEPTSESSMIETGTAFSYSASTNTASNFRLIETNETYTTVISEIATATASTTFASTFIINDNNSHYYKITADFGAGNVKYKTFEVTGYSPVVDETRPGGLKLGANYDAGDPTTATLVLHTPTATNYKKGDGTVSGTSTTTAKNVVHVIGDFNDWTVSDAYKLKRDGDYWWITLTGLESSKEYVYQYLIDGELRIADPYTHKVSESNDQYISNTVYPSLVNYPDDKTNEIASVLQTAQSEYEWATTNFTRPASNELNIYELHFRDFTDEGTYDAATLKLDYLKELGINCIHVMPVSEFEGNDSWGYNPNFYFALDKAYGTATDMKEFIDSAHSKGIAVINDLVLNHAFHSNVMARMYWDDDNGQPAANNPWFNAEHKAVYDESGHWGADWNHESEHTQNLVDSILNYWLNEFKFDGFRFDFTKGFTQTAPDASDPWASSYDGDRIDLLKRMANKMWTDFPGSYAIFEHLANDNEDKVLADYGILLWSGAGPQEPYKNLALGWGDNSNYSLSSSLYTTRGFNYANYISYIESHDEERLGYDVLKYGKLVKDLSGDAQIALAIKRLKLISAFNTLLPGPRMLWQFEELGYDVSINENGRTGRKPVKWEYFDDTNRKQLYRLYSLLLNLRNTYNVYANFDKGNIETNDLTTTRYMKLGDNDNHKIIVLANYDPENAVSYAPTFHDTGTWFQYNGDPAFDGTALTVSALDQSIDLGASELLILTNFDAKKRNQQITFPTITGIDYGETISLAASASSGLSVTYEVVSGSGSIDGNELTATGIDAITVKAVQSGAEYYFAAESEQIITVSKADQTIEFNALTDKTYGDVQFDLAATASSALTVSFISSDETVAQVLGATVTILNAGSTNITASQAGNANYNAASTVMQTLTVKKAELIAAANDANKAYGSDNPALSFTYDGFVNGEDKNVLDTEPILATTATASSNAGEYDITMSGGSDNNYQFAFETGTLTVNKVRLTATANDQTRLYGSENPDLTLSYIGFVNSEDETVLDTKPKASTTATISSNAETYDITVSGGIDNNYIFNYEPASLTINKATLTAVAVDTNKTYGSINPKFAVLYTGFVNDEDTSVIDIKPVGVSGVDTSSGVGSFDITVSGGSDNNYDFVYEAGTLAVNKATLTVSALDQSIIYGSDNPEIEISYAGFVNSEDTSVIDLLPIAAISTTKGSNAGSYYITVSGGSDDNYDFAYETGTLTVNKATLTVTVEDNSKTYGSDNPEFEVSYTGFVNSEDTSVIDVKPVVTTLATAASDVGNYEISVSGGSDNNYDYVYEAGLLTVNKAILKVKAADDSKIYGSANPDLTFSYAGFVNNEDTSVIDSKPVVSTLVTAISDAGNYDISVSGATDNNYDFVYEAGLLSINKASLTVTANDNNKTYGSVNPELTLSYAGFVNSEDTSVIDVKPVVTTLATAVSDVGNYEISVSGGSDNNYNIVYEAGELTINKASLTVKAADNSKTYGSVNPEFAISYAGFVNSEDTSVIDVKPVAASSVTASSDAGTYEITVSGGSDNNYDFAYESGLLTVNKALLNIIADNKEVNEGQDLPEFTLSFNGFVNGDDESVLDNIPETESHATNESVAGEYAIILSGGDDNNYEYELTDGILVILASNSMQEFRKVELKVYPNPTKDYIYIIMKSDENIDECSVYDMSGTIIHNAKNTSFSNEQVIGLNEFIDQDGVYILKIKTENKVLIKRVSFIK